MGNGRFVAPDPYKRIGRKAQRKHQVSVAPSDSEPGKPSRSASLSSVAAMACGLQTSAHGQGEEDISPLGKEERSLLVVQQNAQAVTDAAKQNQSKPHRKARSREARKQKIANLVRNAIVNEFATLLGDTTVATDSKARPQRCPSAPVLRIAARAASRKAAPSRERS